MGRENHILLPYAPHLLPFTFLSLQTFKHSVKFSLDLNDAKGISSQNLTKGYEIL